MPQKYLRGLLGDLEVPKMCLSSALEVPGALRGALRGASELPQRCLTGAVEVSQKCLRGAFEVPWRCFRGVWCPWRCLRGALDVP